MSNLDPIIFAGVLKNITPSQNAGQPDEEAVLDDLEGEKETMPTLEESDITDVGELLDTLKEVSKGVSDRTHDEYRR